MQRNITVTNVGKRSIVDDSSDHTAEKQRNLIRHNEGYPHLQSDVDSDIPGKV